jgi:hypothetical protein
LHTEATLAPTLPEWCFRGIEKATYHDGDDIKLEAFTPDERTASDRSDGGMETSISWDDEPAVAALAHTQRNATHGLAHLKRDIINILNDRRNKMQFLLPERQVVEGNPHHGNIVFHAGLSKTRIKALANALAMDADYILPIKGLPPPPPTQPSRPKPAPPKRGPPDQ